MSDEWRRIKLVHIYKNKGVIQNCINYRRIKLMRHTLKSWEIIIGWRYEMNQMDLHIIFIDLEKTYYKMT
ncbi:hypothetical protein Lal_00047408 [Lupinus albus]|nr:hypothetical protein Lal_00047408 [Lupinus albus]